MTKEQLEEYPDVCAEIEALSRQRENQKRVKELTRQKETVEAFVCALPHSSQRLIVTYRALEGLSWAEVAARMGHRYSVSNVKKIYYSVFKKRSQKSPK